MSKSKIIRQQIWSQLQRRRLPDTRFHLNFAEVIPDFVGSEAATDRWCATAGLRGRRRYAFITPDNCLVDLRRRMMAGRQALRDVDLRHLSRLPADRARHGAPGARALRRLARRHGAFRPADHAGGDRPARAGSTSWSPAPRPCRWTACASARATASSTWNGACSPIWGSSTRRRRWWPWSTMCQVVEEKLTPSETDILVDSIATPTRLHRGRPPRQASARREVGPARARADRRHAAAAGTAAPARAFA